MPTMTSGILREWPVRPRNKINHLELRGDVRADLRSRHLRRLLRVRLLVLCRREVCRYDLSRVGLALLRRCCAKTLLLCKQARARASWPLTSYPD